MRNQWKHFIPKNIHQKHISECLSVVTTMPFTIKHSQLLYIMIRPDAGFIFVSLSIWSSYVWVYNSNKYKRGIKISTEKSNKESEYEYYYIQGENRNPIFMCISIIFLWSPFQENEVCDTMHKNEAGWSSHIHWYEDTYTIICYVNTIKKLKGLEHSSSSGSTKILTKIPSLKKLILFPHFWMSPFLFSFFLESGWIYYKLPVGHSVVRKFSSNVGITKSTFHLNVKFVQSLPHEERTWKISVEKWILRGIQLTLK